MKQKLGGAGADLDIFVSGRDGLLNMNTIWPRADSAHTSGSNE